MTTNDVKKTLFNDYCLCFDLNEAFLNSWFPRCQLNSHQKLSNFVILEEDISRIDQLFSRMTKTRGQERYRTNSFVEWTKQMFTWKKKQKNPFRTVPVTAENFPKWISALSYKWFKLLFRTIDFLENEAGWINFYKGFDRELITASYFKGRNFSEPPKVIPPNLIF